MYQLTPENRLVLLMHGAVGRRSGKMGNGLLRYSTSRVVAVVDREKVGQSLRELTGIPSDVPIVASVKDALAFDPDVLVPAIAPSGGIMPPDWLASDIRDGLSAGLSLVNGLHTPLAADPALAPLITRPGQFIWDIRKEPEGLVVGAGRAREVPAKRVLFVGTDMDIGKMTAALEVTEALIGKGLKAKFLATGQIGISISGEGVPLDAVRLDFASGAIEQMVLKHGYDNHVLLVEGQGSLLNPASTATLPLMRGSMPTHMILVHRAGQPNIIHTPWVKIPPLSEVIRLNEALACAGGALPTVKVVGIALNTAKLSDVEAAAAVEEARLETGLPVTDVVRYGAAPLLAGILTD